MDPRVEQFEILQKHMHSHLEGPDPWLFVWMFF